jgi:hypothetical protein
MASDTRDVWILWHVPPGGDSDKAVLIGVYSSKTAAVAAVARLADKPGFRDHPQVVDDADGPGFFMASYTLNQDGWQDGYRVARDGDWEGTLPAWLPPLPGE